MSGGLTAEDGEEGQESAQPEPSWATSRLKHGILTGHLSLVVCGSRFLGAEGLDQGFSPHCWLLKRKEGHERYAWEGLNLGASCVLFTRGLTMTCQC